MIIDLFLVYNFIKRLATPFEEWDAYKLGIIDENGNIKKKIRELRTAKERNTWSRFDVMLTKLKRLIEKTPGGKTRIASYAAALYLIKESQQGNDVDYEQLTEQEIAPLFEPYIEYVTENLETIVEEVPVNSAGSGNVAGIGVGPKQKAEPGLTPAQMRRHKEKKDRVLSRIKR